ncbi:MAG: oxygen-independent coproporphyrinogen III oxidase, partial [Alphaproteobacteria bacterium]
YVHIPYCDTLCWFCGCQMQHVRRYQPIADYLPVLKREISSVAALVGEHGVTHIHWGGGSPTILEPPDITGLADAIRDAFTVSPAVEFAVEIDPRGFDQDRAKALAAGGLNRASIGVQDFNPKVQETINRHQSFEETLAAVVMLRDLGVASINIDLVYGLPYQTDDDLRRTIDLTASFEPERVSVFGYAHVPWMKTHQRMIPDESLPGPIARFDQMELAARCLVAAGYRRIGIDHFARPDDSLAAALDDGAVHRNFQGYTTDDAEALIGLGASAISRLPQGYVQNQKATGRYMAAIVEKGAAVEKGCALSSDDHMRGWFIERLLSDFSVSRDELEARFGAGAVPLVREAELVAQEKDGLLAAEGPIFRITDTGRPFARAVAARFDAYLGEGAGRHSSAV